MSIRRRSLVYGTAFLTLLLAIQVCWSWESDNLAELSQQELALQYAKTKLDLAEVDLQNA